jgi:hypothetical protein
MNRGVPLLALAAVIHWYRGRDDDTALPRQAVPPAEESPPEGTQQPAESAGRDPDSGQFVFVPSHDESSRD